MNKKEFEQWIDKTLGERYIWVNPDKHIHLMKELEKRDINTITQDDALEMLEEIKIIPKQQQLVDQLNNILEKEGFDDSEKNRILLHRIKGDRLINSLLK
ncbi:MAG: hypothetical protein HQK60_12340 [Deltaproteobacteria bacterium]|nr:hypothetical protein [Deltaproteobacteria bacterium]